MKAVLRNTRISPKKANLVAGIIRGKKVTESLALLKFMPKKAAKTLYKVLNSAASNAKTNYSQSIDDLHVTRILVTKGPTYKRSVPISRGRAHPIRKRTAHITIEVGVLGGVTPKKVEAVAADGKAEKKSVAKKPAAVKAVKPKVAKADKPAKAAKPKAKAADKE